jgi:hypothetical protein
MQRKIFILSVVLLLSAAGVKGQITTVAQGTTGNLTWVLTSDSVLTISGSGDMPNYSNSNSSIPWYLYQNFITTIIIENSVTSIGTWAFRNIVGLDSITIPNSVTIIKDYAFYSCSDLTSVIIPNSVTNIASNAFYSCSSLTSITIPDNITSISSSLFRDCSSLTSIIIPNGVTNIGANAFYGCSSLTSISIPNNVTNIGNYAFSGCSSLDSITIHAITPPALGTDVFANISTNILVYIPCLTYNNYSTDSKWSYFANFIINGMPTIDTTFYTPTHCYDAPYADNNFTNPIDSIGIYCVVLTNSMGCDSVVCLVLTEGITYYSADFCYGNSYSDDNFTNLTQAGVYYDTLQNTYGCDSIVCLNLSYSFYGTTGSLTWHICDSILTISGSGAMSDYYNSTYAPWSSYQSLIKIVIIENGITNIGNSTFTACRNLISITIPNSVTSIGNTAFQSCTNLRSITIPNSVTSIGNNAFYACSGLLSIIIPDSVTSIGSHAFYACSSLTSITIPNSVTSIGNYAFNYCSNLTSLIIGTNVTSIGTSAFVNCPNLTTIDVDSSNVNYASMDDVLFNKSKTRLMLHPASKTDTNYIISSVVTIIDDYAFEGCNNLTSITIPDSVTSIGSYAFRNCMNLLTVNYNAISCTTMGNGSSAFQGCTALATLNIGIKVKIIPSRAFQGLSALTTLTIPDSVTNIKGYAFQDCINLQTINYNAINCVEMYASMPPFSGCTTLTTLNIGNMVQSVPESAFRNQTNLTSVTFGNNVKNIGSSAFYNCSSLTTITIPDSVITLGYHAFQNCSNLQTINYNANNCIWIHSNYPPFSGCSAVTNLIIGNGVQTIPNSIFADFSNLTSLTIPNNVKNIGYSAFSNCSNLTSLTIGNNVETIGNSVFYRCSSLTSITIPESVTSLGTWAFGYCTDLQTINYNAINCAEMPTAFHPFEGCSTLTTLNIGNAVQSIPKNAFINCNRLISLTIPDNVISIGEAAFKGCDSVISLYIGNNVTNIGYNAFQNCTRLQTINYNAINCPEMLGYWTSSAAHPFDGCRALSILNIGDSVQIIPIHAFWPSSSLTTVNIGNNVRTIGASAFSGSTSLNSLTMGNSIITIENSAFTNCQSLDSIILPNSITSIGNYAFSGCSGLMFITIPDSVISIGKSAFANCFNLQTVNYNAINCTTMGENWVTTFNTCSTFTTLNIGNIVQSIPNYAFANCSTLTSITINAIIPPVLTTYTFYNVPANIPVYIPCGTYNAYHNANRWSNFTNLITNGGTPTADTTFYNAETCSEFYTDNNFTTPIYQSGIYYVALPNSTGCDSIVCLILTANPITYYAATICSGKIYADDNFTNLTQAGIYYDTLQNINGCDSIICLTLTEYANIPVTYYSAGMCPNKTYTDNNFTNLAQAGTYYDTLQNTNGCDSVICLTLTESFVHCDSIISGNVMYANQTPFSLGVVELYLVQNGGQYILSNTAIIANNGSYLFTNVEDGDYIIKVIPDTSQNALPTYYGNTELWNQASVISMTNSNSLDSVNIIIIPLDSLDGNSFISGYVGEEDDGTKSLSQKSVNHPVKDANVYLQSLENSSWKTIARTLSNIEGYFEFKNVPMGTHRAILDVPGLIIIDFQTIEVNGGDTINGIEFEITSEGINNNTTGIISFTKENINIEVYPNPAATQLYIKHSLQKITDYRIYNVTGQLIQQGKLQDELSVIQVESLSKGIYYLKISNTTVKFLKQ